MSNVTEIKVSKVISVKELADKLNLPVTKLIMMLMKSGIMATINESIDFETAAIISEEFGVSAILDENKVVKEPIADDKSLKYRSPVVTIMGHVDHGKTTLLDRIRQSSVAAGESGGITQHISAYKVKTSKKSDHGIDSITFLDTPGHAAFTAMRQHGANITDIIVLVVAANDGVKTQTIEVVDNAKSANVPLIIAVNKTDLPDANMDRVKQQLAELEVVPEDWGGNTVFVPISAKTGAGIDSLMDVILLSADIKELKASYSGRASGVIVESHMEPGRGPVATALIQNGVIKSGDNISIGAIYGKVRILEDFNGQKIDDAYPSDPIIITGIKGVPNFGDPLVVVDNEKEAKENAARYGSDNRDFVIHSFKDQKLEDNVTDKVDSRQLPVLIRADVKGSLEALQKSINDIDSTEVKVDIVSAEIGAVSESDINMASATKASILAFRVPISSSVHNLASTNKVFIKRYDVIYEMIDDIKKALSKLLPKEEYEVVQGSAKVIALFSGDKKRRVAGVQINEGIIRKDAKYHLLRNDKVVFDGDILKVKREKDEVKEAIAGQQAGLLIQGNADIKEGDIINTYEVSYRERAIS